MALTCAVFAGEKNSKPGGDKSMLKRLVQHVGLGNG
jgi:hypothetical protein